MAVIAGVYSNVLLWKTAVQKAGRFSGGLRVNSVTVYGRQGVNSVFMYYRQAVQWQ